MDARYAWTRVVAVAAAVIVALGAPHVALADQPPADVAGTATWLSSERRVSGADESGNYSPAVAYNSQHGEFLVAWQRLRSDSCYEIVGRRVADGGAPLGSEFVIATEVFSQQRAYPALAYNATLDEYAVVYLSAGYAGQLVPGQVNQVRGRTVSWDGATLGNEQLIYEWANRSFWQPRIAWNSTDNRYMVVWFASDTGTGKPTDVASFPLYNDLSPVYPVAYLVSYTHEPMQPDIAYNQAMGEFLVVWWETWPGSNDRDVFGARLDRLTGAKVLAAWPIAYSGDDEDAPAVTTNGQSRYLVVWDRYTPGNPDVQGLELAGDGTAVDGYLDIATTSASEAFPRVAARPGPTREYMVTFVRFSAGRFQIVSRCWGDGPGGGGEFAVASDAPLSRDEPVVAAGDRGFLFGYDGYSASPGSTVPARIYSRYFWRDIELNFLPVVRQ